MLSRAPRAALPTTGLLVGLLTALVLVAVPAEAAVTRTVRMHATPGAALNATTVTFSGILTHTPRGSLVRVQRKQGSTWVRAGSARTSDRAGHWSVQLALPAVVGRITYRAFAPRRPGLRGDLSPLVRVLSLRPTQWQVPPFHAGGHPAPETPFEITGSLQAPYTAGGVVTLQRWTGSAWVTDRTGVVPADGRITLLSTGAVDPTDYRMVVSRAGFNARLVSDPVTVVPVKGA